MKFQRKISPETRKILLAQLEEFEREVRMTKAERAALHDWVSAGHSPYDNEQNLYFDTSPLDFVSALRFTQAFEEMLSGLSPEARHEELKKISYQYDTVADTIAIDVSACFPLPKTDAAAKRDKKGCLPKRRFTVLMIRSRKRAAPSKELACHAAPFLSPAVTRQNGRMGSGCMSPADSQKRRRLRYFAQAA